MSLRWERVCVGMVSWQQEGGVMGTSAWIDPCTDQATNAPRRALRPSPTLHTARVHGCRLCRRPRWRMHKPPERRGAAAMSPREHGTLRVGRWWRRLSFSESVSSGALSLSRPSPMTPAHLSPRRAVRPLALPCGGTSTWTPCPTRRRCSSSGGRRVDSALAAADDPRRARVSPSGRGRAKRLRPQRPGVAA